MNIQKIMPGFVIQPNPNKEIFDEVSQAIHKNGNYCCCAITKEPDTMCVCKAFREQEDSGFCHCGRFYKVRKFSTIAILCSPADSARADSVAESLTTQGFIVMTPSYRDVAFYSTNSQIFDEIQKAKIEKSDIVLVLNSSQEAVDFLSEQIYWAEELQKKVLYEQMEEVEENEN